MLKAVYREDTAWRASFSPREKILTHASACRAFLELSLIADDPQLLHMAVAGHAHKPTKSPRRCPRTRFPRQHQVTPLSRRQVPEQGSAHTEEVAPDTLPGMTNGWAESSGSNRSLGKQERDPRAMSPSTRFGPN